MPEPFATYLRHKRISLALVGAAHVTQEKMAEYLAPKVSEQLGRQVEISRRAYNKWEKGLTVPPYASTIRSILG